MYLTHYNFEIKPFESSPDPKFFWLGEKHKEVLAALKFGIQENKGFTLLTGGIGSGKTTLVSCFLKENDTGSVIMSIPDPDLTVKDFFSLLADEFGFNIDFKTRGEFLVKFKILLEDTYSDQKNVLLIIDEAQRLNRQILEQIRLLATIERRDLNFLSIILVGQNDLHECVLDAKNRGLPQKIAVHCHIKPLTEAETRDYIDHRLRVAESEKEIFNPGAISEIFSFSKGCPRLINTICDRALLTGYAKGISQIDRKIVQKSADELALPGERGHAETAREKPEGETRNKNNHEAAEEKPDTELKKENNSESAAAESEAEAAIDTNRDATENEPEAGAVAFTWGSGAKPKPLRVSVNDRELPSHNKLMPAPRIMVAAVAILILTAIVLYLWLGA